MKISIERHRTEMAFDAGDICEVLYALVWMAGWLLVMYWFVVRLLKKWTG